MPHELAYQAASNRRVALVTGASRGIGAAIARQLLDRDCLVAGGYRTGHAAVAGLSDEYPDRVLPVAMDLADDTSAVLAVEQVLSAWSGLDSLVLNAGIWQGGQLVDMDSADWWRVVEVNVRGTTALARAALPALMCGREPSILLVSSVVGLVGYAGDTSYASAKAAVIGFARSLAKEVGRAGIRVNVLAPGFVDTEMTAKVPARSRAAIVKDTVLRRFGTVEEIAKAAVFLSEDATYCTGTVLTADGGWST
ncbi:SDR family oxidoreductase [Actinophytocola sp.]|uniref:SDR family oxidoreductase n=1 Tax=Actinophytocola sp. TaxID=1872138 RepID=UPI003D6AEEA2